MHHSVLATGRNKIIGDKVYQLTLFTISEIQGPEILPQMSQKANRLRANEAWVTASLPTMVWASFEKWIGIKFEMFVYPMALSAWAVIRNQNL